MHTMRILVGMMLALVLVTVGCGRSDQPREMENTQGEPAAESATQGWTLADAGFKTPESVLHDAEDDVYYVSNLGGPQPLEKDGNGFISKVSPEGEILELKWISGDQEGVELNAPKGMARYGDLLLVSDIDVLRAFAIDTAEPLWAAELPGATFANDVWAAKGVIYVTDTGTEGPGAIYTVTIKGHANNPQVETLVRDTGLMNPNGIIEANGQVWMVPYGGSGVFKIMDDGSFEKVAEAPKGSLDGLVMLEDGRLVFTSWEAKTVYVMGEGNAIVPMFTGLESPADIGYDPGRNLLLIPQFMLDKVVAKPVM